MDECVQVNLTRQAFHLRSAFPAFITLREEFGGDQVYLLESLAGPERDRTQALIGVDRLAWVTVREGDVLLGGRPVITELLHRRVADCPGVVECPDGTFAIRRPVDAWDVLRTVQAAFDVPHATDARMDFGFLAVLGYDAVRYIEDIPRLIPGPEAGAPDILLTLYSTIVDADLRTGTATVWSSSSPLWEPIDPEVVVAVALSGAGESAAHEAEPASTPTKGIARLTTDAETYFHRVEVAMEHVRLGDVYQVQVGHEVELVTEVGDVDVYRKLRELNPSPFMGFLPLPDGSTLMSASPELHVLLERGGATMRPIAGTVPRTGNQESDRAAVAGLVVDEKERAEHVMLVDLCRNDLGRVAVPGSVDVSDLMRVEPYSHVFHLVSTVTATIEATADVYDVLRATFPAGTMTGAPKVRAMEVIETLETTRRGLYAGVFGVIGLGGYANLALTIRTVVRHGERLTTRASAGVVDGSTPKGEWRETLAKLNAAVLAVSGRTLA